MAWNKYGIQNWDIPGLTFAPLELIAATLTEATSERLLAAGIANQLAPVDELTFEPHLTGEPSLPQSSGIPASGTSVRLLTYRQLVTLDQIICDAFGGDTTDPDPPAEDSVFVNILDHGANWNRSPDAPPLWGKESMLAALGQDEFIRLTSPHYFTPLLPAWAEQCYKILNLCTSTRSRLAYLFNPLPDGYYLKEAAGATYADMVAAWPAEWTYVAGLVISGDRAVTDGDDGGQVRGSRVYISDNQNHSYTAATDQLFRDDTIYMYTQKDGDRWNRDGNDWEENTWARIGSLKAQKGTSNKFDLREFLSSGPTPDPHNEDTVGWFIDGRDAVVNPVGVTGYAILNWAAPGGFSYTA